MRQRSKPHHRPFQSLALGVALGLPLSAWAQSASTVASSPFQRSDRQPARTTDPVERSEGGPSVVVSQLSPAATLPLELRQTAGRYPVTLYGQAGCDACNTGRQYLRQRGIPYNERLVNDGDGEALERATGGRQLPVLTIGNQVLRGYAADQWASYLDAAGYPKQSRLPPTYVAPPATPLVAAPAPAAPTAVVPSPPPPAIAAPPAPGGIRF